MMIPNRKTTTTVTGAVAALLSTNAGKAAIVAGDPAAGGIGYAFNGTIGENDTAFFKSHVGAWSWEDEGVFTPGIDPPVGWTHTSNWVAVTLTHAVTLNLSMTRDATVTYAGSGNVGGFAATDFMFPSFTIWSGWDNDGSDDHTYQNTSNVSWAEDLTYLDHTRNNTLDTVSDSWVLPAGNYTFVFGSDAPSSSNPPRQGYNVTFTTSPVPEPSSALITGLFALSVMVGNRKRSVALN